MADPDPAPNLAPPEGGAPAAAPEPADTGPPGTGPSGTGPPGTATARVRDAPGRPDVRALVRVQLRIALQTAAIVLTVIAAIPALLALARDLGGTGPFGLPPSWLLPVLGVQPLWVIAALVHLHRAERAERDHTRPADRA